MIKNYIRCLFGSTSSFDGEPENRDHLNANQGAYLTAL